MACWTVELIRFASNVQHGLMGPVFGSGVGLTHRLVGLLYGVTLGGA